jgi:hypothetical protein
MIFYLSQVQLDTGNFLWLSPLGLSLRQERRSLTDLQAWARDEFLRNGYRRRNSSTNFQSFSLEGDPTPLPGALPLLATGLGVIGLLAGLRKRNAAAIAA